MVLRQLAQIRRSCENNPFFDTMFRAGIFATYAAITFGVVPSGPSNIIGGVEAAEAAVPVREPEGLGESRDSPVDALVLSPIVAIYWLVFLASFLGDAFEHYRCHRLRIRSLKRESGDDVLTLYDVYMSRLSLGG
ncbi:hypothetical protein AAVH_08348 [Aphelenchoides avenae]|nr:hypothetical protein AAVH_08348 [Aphelenchus avenae]